MLIDFWSNHATYGFHPDDIPYISNNHILNWSVDEALAHKDSFDKDSALHKLLHVNLFPWPFVGDIEHASVVILYGNPGVEPANYLEEHSNTTHIQACIKNLSGRAKSFFVLESDSKGTGGHRYWLPRFNRLVDELASALSITRNKAFRVAIRNIALIEAGAYPSKGSPGSWFDKLPSSKVAREFVHQKLLPRARKGEILIFVWRRASQWGIPLDTPGVIIRPPKEAQVAYLYASERTAIVKQIRVHYRKSLGVL